MESEIKLCEKLIQDYNSRAMAAKSFEIFKSFMFLSSILELRIKAYQIQSRLESI